ncbi:hypothetical protein ASPACDRAFT_54443 [Aspergillus aculeatus ATCC 16872]|uniref:Major facilitator superfamily (MFS) profile domain-containing protein n=1 Tax=Aspergillus aculeatus (strain ATCC 16872 / CBS 172.66 / WB 5094) TaxID=690307 RepID=A0A1L9WK73_ASPA1|nr:uncharacterized protein ASPACDRAFT_54443 [Aspergillus aculeatus ATCC 16872]OJJ96560.1 hypothetical protein ASPACDRAFT_54443 [Aspergillus aculeatus ATCC 16872]
MSLHLEKSNQCSNDALEDNESSSAHSDDDLQHLHHVADSLPPRVWIAASIAIFERFTYEGTQSTFQNYLQHSPSDSIPGALGLGESRANTVNLAFTVLVNILPLPISILVDGRLGRYLALQMFFVIYALGSLTLFITSLPVMMHNGAAAPGFAVGAALIAIGLGGVLASLQPFIADQYTDPGGRIETRPNGRRVVWMTNLGAMGALATTMMERYVGFWSSYLLALCSVLLCLVIVQAAGRIFVHPPPQSSVLPQAAQCLWYACLSGFNLEACYPHTQLTMHQRVVPWDEGFITELRSGLSAFKICMGWPIFWLCMSQASQQGISQAGTMQSHGIPNDVPKVSNPVAYILFGILVQKMLYLFLQRIGILFNPVNRITLGFLIMSLAMTYFAVLQAAIYHTRPCYDHLLACAASNSDHGQITNQVHILIQLPTYIIIALAEVFCWPTGAEYLYTHSPKSMKSVMQACYVGTLALGYGLGMVLSPLAKDPYLVILWSLAAGLVFVCACVFWVAFRRLGRDSSG